MSAPSHLERCNAEFVERLSEKSWLIVARVTSRVHVCYVEAGHGGAHECGCGFEWEDEWEQLVSPGNPAVQEQDIKNERIGHEIHEEE